MIRLEEAGYINLPARKQIPPNNLGNRIKPTRISIDQSPIHGKPSLFPERKFEEVKRTPKEKLFNSLIDEFHYLCYSQLVGEHLKYILFLDERPVSCIAFSSSPLHIGCRDRFIGWSKTAREKNRHLISYNTRFLILPWVSIKNLASFILGWICQNISQDWETRYNHPIYFLETFVDEARFRGTCYKASNWIFLGKTTGRGENGHRGRANRTVKTVYGYPLTKDFKSKLQNG